MTSRTSKPSLLVRASAAVGATLITALGATLIIGGATSAFAATPAEAPSIRVNYQDLNLATEQGTLALYGRIESAAKKVCPVTDIRNLSEFAAAKECRDQAIERAVREVGNERLAAVYTARKGHG